MASTEASSRVHDRPTRRRPFTTWMRRLANLKTLHVDAGDTSASPRRSNLPMTIKSKKGNIAKNNPYPLSSRAEAQSNGPTSVSAPLSSQRSRHSSVSQSKHSMSVSHESQAGNKSKAPTLATQAETAMSDAAPSGVGTSATAAKTDGGRDSTFSSPAPSVRSMATTLTTVQSIAPGYNHPAAPMATNTSNASVPTQHYPGQPATAVPAHLAPHAHPTTYHSATANNALTDDASILTLASSSKRRRRNSVDTNASMKALAPASMFGGSRDSLPLSVLSGTIIHPTADTASVRDGGGVAHTRSNFSAERSSLISTSGVTAPALASERNSYIGSKYGDGASVRSGLLGAGHGRNDSISGSIGGYREKGEKDKERERDRDKDRETGMVTAPTSPLVDGPGVGTQYTTALGDVSKTLDREEKIGALEG
ncbi:hypothetical protein HRR83_004338 [Exophiala dermatitidis]|uniref:Ca2+-modulated nonselective cation channel polycystin n=2 Tax=Exophiala dermatitidis TaxID=5970 RepID=H6BQE6_EXODN|nr:uncharacterized protein HMPREF1120_02707 [Exophiala dermatitidis NIH/UT8656]KAJ4511624.1 hypothetical protein HRR73_006199 [Exophiala dermatitidis]EHY54539.1 hypothetical protein HMPREF1120_02707 [Exophiala dermatitidis NIH/UT8656]KAJ4517700.1 hypothetical protein HRR75_002918 [Exophiala dermatitidis]KAJ4521357.1 hypothetical protein HRR74_003180 [Exophiala dermatitidis]KAJ4542028.1 hypothetical protein HRR77_005916 [Exophiala dermatitidis]